MPVAVGGGVEGFDPHATGPPQAPQGRHLLGTDRDVWKNDQGAAAAEEQLTQHQDLGHEGLAGARGRDVDHRPAFQHPGSGEALCLPLVEFPHSAIPVAGLDALRDAPIGEFPKVATPSPAGKGLQVLRPLDDRIAGPVRGDAPNLQISLVCSRRAKGPGALDERLAPKSHINGLPLAINDPGAPLRHTPRYRILRQLLPSPPRRRPLRTGQDPGQAEPCTFRSA
mmetsp:Transcript_4300/g.16153  ORF Transcript_4300/g.16153 Transcript_4300/m.16153 type:complete len:225 (+) Transcript_4300:1968-2642(+)